jgi:phospholipase C
MILPKQLSALGLFAIALSFGCSNQAISTDTQPQLASQRVLPTIRRNAGLSKYISNVVVIIQENRSFENFFAGYPGANAPMTGCASPVPSSKPSQQVAAAVDPMLSPSPCPSGDTVVPLQQVTFENNPDPDHTWPSSIVDWDNGRMDGFSHWGTPGNRYRVYVYIERSQVQIYWNLAQQYVLADAMFPTEFGGSFTAHLTLVAGTDDIVLPGVAEVDFPSAIPDDCDAPPGTKSSLLSEKPYRKEWFFAGPYPCFDQFNTIAQVLDSAGISWKYYATKLVDAGFWEPFEGIRYTRYGPDWHTNIIVPQTRILTDPQNHNLASVTWVTPSKDDSDHPTFHSDQGPSWVASVINAIGESSYWRKTAIIVLWDDWGGFYDNAAPPQLDYRGLGIRVPCLIISPYAKKDYVSHVQYEYGSILHFIEEVYGLPVGSIGPTSEGYTDARATSLDDAFDFSQRPRKFSPIATKYPFSHFVHEPPSNVPVDTQ